MSNTPIVDTSPPMHGRAAALAGTAIAPASEAPSCRRHAPLWLVLLLLLASHLVTACGGDDDGTRDVSLATLAAQEGAYDGTLVRTQGVVRTFVQPRHYWIEDDYPNRVALEPEELVAPLLGQTVRVVGRFNFDERKGRLIRVEEIASLSPGTSGGSR